MSAPGRTLLCLLLLGCGPVQDSPLGAARRGIVGGVEDPSDPAVVAVRVAFSPACSGTLIGPRTVLTAGHCATPGVELLYEVAFGAQESAPLAVADVERIHRHPGYDAQTLAHDLALLELSAPVLGVEPALLRPQALAPSDVGRTVRLVGFGATRGGSSAGKGVKRTVSYPLRRLLPLSFESGADGQQTCDGDSGGPALLRDFPAQPELVVGVTSTGDDACLTEGYSARVDVDLEWIHQTAARFDRLPGCAKDARCLPGCAPQDPDCASCAADGQCAGGCQPRDPDCPDPCAADGQCAEACAAPDPDCVPAGEGCVDDGQCAGRRCLEDGGRRYCADPCSAGACPGALLCRDGRCLHPPPDAGPPAGPAAPPAAQDSEAVRASGCAAGTEGLGGGGWWLVLLPGVARACRRRPG